MFSTVFTVFSNVLNGFSTVFPVIYTVFTVFSQYSLCFSCIHYISLEFEDSPKNGKFRQKVKVNTLTF